MEYRRGQLKDGYNTTWTHDTTNFKNFGHETVWYDNKLYLCHIYTAY